jgi:CRISPR-associated protein Cas2
MLVISLSECPPALKGDMTKWLLEISPGVYVGKVSSRVRDNLWERIRETIKSGKAIMAYNAKNEQGLNFKVHNAEWEPIEFDGIKLMLRPSQSRIKKPGQVRIGYSNASKYRMAKKRSRPWQTP